MKTKYLSLFFIWSLVLLLLPFKVNSQNPTLTPAYGYITSSQLFPEGPCRFFLERPDSIIFLAPTTSVDPIGAGCWANGNWYVAETIDSAAGYTHGHLYSVNTVTGTMTDIGPLGVALTGLTYDWYSQTMYGIAYTQGITGPNHSRLYTVNIATGAVTFAHDLYCRIALPAGLACSSAGTLYSYDVLYKRLSGIMPSNGAAFFSWPWHGGSGGIADADFEFQTNKLYLTGSSLSPGLKSCKIGDGEITDIGLFQGNSVITGMAIPYWPGVQMIDMAVTLINSPFSGIIFPTPNVAVLIANLGLTSVADFDLSLQINDGPVFTENWSIYTGGYVLLPGEMMNYPFQTEEWWVSGPCLIKVWISNLSGDGRPQNDTTSRCVYSFYGFTDCLTGNIPEQGPCGSDLNGGCFSSTPAFENIQPGDTYCGSMWEIGCDRDSDWYSFSLTNSGNVNFLVYSAIEMEVKLIRLPCNTMTVVEELTIIPNTTDTISQAALPAGDYALMLSPLNLNFQCIPGYNNYRVRYDTVLMSTCKPGSLYNNLYISQVENGSISNSSGYSNGGYFCYSGLATQMIPAVPSVITVSGFNAGATDSCGIWADWNRDNDFNDAGERIYLSSPAFGPGPFTATITPPSTITTGGVWLRVRLMRNTLLTPCGFSQYGETEDYHIQIIDPSQPVHAFMPVTQTCQGQVSIPLCVSNSFVVNNLQLRVPLPAGLTYLGYQQVLPQLAPNLSVTFFADTITLNWFSSTAISLNNDTLLRLNLDGLPGNYQLKWDTLPGHCFISNSYFGNFGLVLQNTAISIIACDSVSGYVVYDNATQTQLNNAGLVSLLPLNPPGPVVNYTLTNNDYGFGNLLTGTYSLQAYINLPWGGVNATDGLQILKHFVGIITLTGLRLKAADVNGDNVVTSIDAMMIIRRFTGQISAFPVGDWLSETVQIQLGPSQNQHPVIKCICAGDADGSYVP